MADRAVLQMAQATSQDKKFWGDSVKCRQDRDPLSYHQLLMMAIVQKKMRIERSIYELSQIVSISFTDTMSLKDLIGKPNYNIVNELDDSSEPTLF